MRSSHLSPSRFGRHVSIVLLVVALLFNGLAPAFASSMDDDPKATSATNPWDMSNVETWWRFGWGQSDHPELTMSPGEDTATAGTASGNTIPTLGFIYRIDRTLGSFPTTGDPVVDLSGDKTGSLFSHTFDLRGVLASAPAGQWGYVPLPGQSDPVEGPWYVHLRFFNALRVIDPSSTKTYGLSVDVTPPNPVSGFTSSASGSPTTTPVVLPSGVTTDVSVIAHTRNMYSWDPIQYDALAGDGRFLVDLNGDQSQTYVYNLLYLGVPYHVTIEDLKTGLNAVQVRTIDRAGNQSVPRTIYTVVDTDTPVLQITHPTAGMGPLQHHYLMSADATDMAGIRSVVFNIDGSSVATVTQPPYQYDCDANSLIEGVPHLLTVTARDLCGHSVDATRSFQVERAVPTASIDQPLTDGQTLRDTFKFRATAAAESPAVLTRVVFSVDGTSVATETAGPYTYDLDTALWPEGPHTMFVTAYDSLGKSAQAVRTFSISHSPAAIEATPSVGMDGHDIEDTSTLWWTNSVTPNMSFSAVNGAGMGKTIGYYYLVDRQPSSIPTHGSDTTSLQYPLTMQTLDMDGIGRLYPSPMTSGEQNQAEGDNWNIHVRSYTATAGGLSGVTAHGHFGLDITPPSPVSGLSIDTTGWTEVFRHRLSWIDKVYDLRGPGIWTYPFVRGYDSLSGDHKWRLIVNGGEPIDWDRYNGSPLAAATVENGLHNGHNTISVQVIDYAGNVSAPTYAYVDIDHDIPTVTINTPSANELLAGTVDFSADAQDGAGISQVKFDIDGVTRQATASSTMHFDTHALSKGAHTLNVTVTDMFGHTASTSTTFSVDNSAPPVLPGIEATPTVTMFGEDIQDPNVIWFTNSLTPEMGFSSVNGAGLGDTTGYYYVVDRSTSSVPTIGSDFTPQQNPMTMKTLDMSGLGRLHPSPMLFGEHDPVEGDDWNIHVRSNTATSAGLSSITAHGHFGLDVTPPSPVSGLMSDVSGWTEVFRHRLSWIDKVYELRGPGMWTYPFERGYDSLSGDHKWRVIVNGGTPVDWDRFNGSPLAAVTVENGLHVGKNTISVQVIDYAGNVSAPVYSYIDIDNDIPTVAITAPSVDQWVAGRTNFTVNAKDGAGISQVQYKIDNVTRETTVASSMSFDTHALSTGEHTLSVTVKDMYGHTATATRKFNVDNVTPTITNISDTPDPFFPSIREGYKDSSTVSVKTNKAVTNLYFEVFNGSSLVRQYRWTNVGAGTFKAYWDGKDARGNVMVPAFGSGPASRTYYYRLRAVDRAGVQVTTAKYPTTLRNYEVVLLSAGKVKVVPR
jgi:hypothetical protein